MNDDAVFRLVSDLARLVRKYGPDPFEDLAERLEDPAFMAALTKGLRGLATHSRASRVKPQLSRRNEVEWILTQLRESDPAKYESVTRIREGLRAKRNASRVTDIQGLTRSLGAVPNETRFREDAIVDLLLALAGAAVEDVRAIESRLQSQRPPQPNAGTLKGWSEVILGETNRE